MKQVNVSCELGFKACFNFINKKIPSSIINNKIWNVIGKYMAYDNKRSSKTRLRVTCSTALISFFVLEETKRTRMPVFSEEQDG